MYVRINASVYVYIYVCVYVNIVVCMYAVKRVHALCM